MTGTVGYGCVIAWSSVLPPGLHAYSVLATPLHFTKEGGAYNQTRSDRVEMALDQLITVGNVISMLLLFSRHVYKGNSYSQTEKQFKKTKLHELKSIKTNKEEIKY